MKKILTFGLCLFAIITFAQDNNYNISLGAHIPDQAEGIPSSAQSILINKLGQVITQNGISDNVYNSRFIITPKIDVLTKDVLPTAPPQVAINLQVTFYIGDGVAGNLFSSETIQVKGVGSNENKAYIEAIKQIKPKDKQLQDFIAKGKAKIIDYYNTNCAQIIAESTTLENQNNLEEAMSLLINVPVSSDCFDKVKGKIEGIYTKTINRDCKIKLNEAQAIWSANQDIQAANDAAYILSTVDPQASCFGEVKSLFSKIESRAKELKDRDWNYKLKVLDAVKTSIMAAREIELAYAKNQPKTVTYNVRGWY